MCFIPALTAYTLAGFQVLAQTPAWYQYGLGIMISASFGYKKFADYMAKT